MSVKEIISNYKAIQEKQQEEARQQEAGRTYDERTRRRLNAGKVEQHLREVVQPALEATRKEIREEGFPCNVEMRSQRDPDISEEEQTFAMCLKLTVERDGMSESAWLQYCGQSDSATLELTEYYGNGAESVTGGSTELRAYSREVVERQVKEFIQAVFTIERQEDDFYQRRRLQRNGRSWQTLKKMYGGIK